MGRFDRKNNKKHYDRKNKDMEDKNINPEEMAEDAVIVDDVNSTVSENEEASEEVAEETVSLAEENEKLKAEVEKEKKEYLFLMAEFEISVNAL